jgi:hypothetical protein
MRWRFSYRDRVTGTERVGSVTVDHASEVEAKIAAVYGAVLDGDRGVWGLAPDPERPE